MYHTRSTNIVDKENEDAAPSRVLTRQQSSTNLLPRTPSKQHVQQQQQLPLKAAAAMPGTPSHSSKQAATMPSTPTGHSILRAKTNQQLPTTPSAQGTKSNNNNNKKSTLARTFSATTGNVEEATKENLPEDAPQQPRPSALQSPDIAALAAADTRRKSLTRRGSNVRERLIVHRDEPSVDSASESAATTPSKSFQEAPSHSSPSTHAAPTALTPTRRTSHRKKSLIRRETVAERASENATTTLAIERSQSSSDKVVVGEGKTESKRRALSKEQEEDVEIEYCPPRQQEQPYECEVQIDKRVFDLHPPAMAYYVRGIEDFEAPLPSFEEAETRRKPALALVDHLDERATKKDDNGKKGPDSDGQPNTGAESDNVERARAEEESELEATLHPEGSPTFGIVDLHDTSKTLPPFDGFLFDVDDLGNDKSVTKETKKKTLQASRLPVKSSVRRVHMPVAKPSKPSTTIRQVGARTVSTSVASSTKASLRTVSERTQRVQPIKARPTKTTTTPSSSSSKAAASAPAPKATISSSSLPEANTTTDKALLKDIGLEDLEDSSKVETSFADFQFDL
ncbi:hypothetical protein BGW42_003720 [Actinomortierella wolfii]|nr:hypothetical protein BGW42_003720 [Actinomortierella wolfii]